MLNAKLTKKSQKAVLYYGPAEFTILKSGSFVICAQSGEEIDIEELVYWSVEFQEAYKDAASMWTRRQRRMHK